MPLVRSARHSWKQPDREWSQALNGSGFGHVAGWWIERFERRLATGERGERTLDFRRYHLEHHLLPAFASRPLREITAYRALIASALYTGMRRSELLGLIWREGEPSEPWPSDRLRVFRPHPYNRLSEGFGSLCNSLLGKHAYASRALGFLTAYGDVDG